MTYVVVFPVEASLPHLWDGTDRFKSLCGRWSVSGEDATGEGGSFAIDKLIADEFICKTCARKAGLIP